MLGPVSKYVACPFCGRRGLRTKEHVWAQWLHETEGARTLLQGTVGERIPTPDQVVSRSEAGRYELRTDKPGRYAKWLPNVTVDVCKECNTGWMSRLENSAKAILGPFVFDGSSLRLSPDDLHVLAAWATKSWMAYALTRPRQFNPFSDDDYRLMSTSPAALDRSRIWLMHSKAGPAHVAMEISSTYLGFGPPDDLEVPDNAAFAYLAASTVVFVMLLVPDDGPQDMAEVMTLPSLRIEQVLRIWPTPPPQSFPTEEVPEDVLLGLIGDGLSLWEVIGLPVVGLTDADAAQVHRDFLDGEDPAVLRRAWDGGGIRSAMLRRYIAWRRLRRRAAQAMARLHLGDRQERSDRHEPKGEP